MHIRYVVSTMVFWGRENHLSFEQECEFLKSFGFGVELWPNIKGHTDCRYARRNWPRLLEATRDMPVSMMSRDDDPTLEQWKEQIECAKMLNSDIVTDLESFGIPEGSDVNGCDFSVEVVRLAEQNKVKLCIETGDLGRVRQVGERFGSVFYCLDVGHANLDPAYTFKQYVDELAERVIHLHLNDNYGQIDDHQPPGLRGGIGGEDWEYLLKSLDKFDNEVTGSFEMCPCTPDVMIRQAGEFLFDRLRWPDRPQEKPTHTRTSYNTNPTN